jgi:phosphoribosylamine---glycine ligase
MLEGSKEFAKKFMCKYHIPTAAYRSFTPDQEEDAFMFLKTLTPPYVLKADGLAAGKGVLIVKNYDEACKSLSEMLSGKFGEASGKVVIEQFLSGIEVSSFILTDGKDYLLLPEAKDYKRIGDGDTGLNTGGMGAVSPVPFFDDVFRKKVEERIIIPTVKGIQAEGYRYSGFVFIGLMNCGGDPYVIEYNVRMGDPETESVMMRIKSDFLSHLVAAARGNLSLESLKITEKTALTTVVVSGGYPESYVKGYKIDGLDLLNNLTVFHSGTAFKGDTTVTSGGRVLALTALGESIDDAREIIYSQIDKIRFTDRNYRKDIGLDLE